MIKDMVLTILLYTTAELLLLLCTYRLLGIHINIIRTILAVLFGCCFCTVCLCFPSAIISNAIGRIMSLAAMAILAYGMHLHPCMLFILLSVALGGIIPNMEKVWVLMLGTTIIGVICILGFKGGDVGRCVPVILRHNDRSIALTALRDTGNTLRDPISGQPVMVVAGKTGEALFDLTPEDIALPVQGIQNLPGSRLIPFHSIGCESGFLLAMRICDVTIGEWTGSYLVAFAPQGLDTGEFQALIGGMI